MGNIPYVTLSSDFKVQSQGIAAMEAQFFRIAPEARVVHLHHGIAEFDIRAGARALETLDTHPVGFHVCVVDPGVGTNRHPIVIKTKRGDYLIGPDNGILIPAAESFLGGIEEARIIENPEFMRDKVSPIFHGRDIFAPAAASLASGKSFEGVGRDLDIRELCPAPYGEARREKDKLAAEIISINHFGSLHLNITHDAWDSLSFSLGSEVKAKFPDTSSDKTIRLTYSTTFGDVGEGENVVLKDDYGRVEMATNLGRFIDQTQSKNGDQVHILL